MEGRSRHLLIAELAFSSAVPAGLDIFFRCSRVASARAFVPAAAFLAALSRASGTRLPPVRVDDTDDDIEEDDEEDLYPFPSFLSVLTLLDAAIAAVGEAIC